MSFFKKVLASVGIGGVKVDTHLHNSQFVAGEKITGVIVIQGGDVEQQIGPVYLNLMTQYRREQNDHKVIETVCFDSYAIGERGSIEPGQRFEIPFDITLPQDAPVSTREFPIWINTTLDVESAVDPGDKDYIEVLPHAYVNVVHHAMEQLGFHLRKVESEHLGYFSRGRMPFVQEWEYVPTRQFRGQLDELEIVFFPKDDGVELLIEVDRRARGLSGFFAEAMNLDETKQRTYLSRSQLEQGPAAVAGLLERYISQFV